MTKVLKATKRDDVPLKALLLGALAAIGSAGPSAFAAERSEGHAEARAEGEHGEREEGGTESEAPFAIALDLVLGFGKVDAVDLAPTAATPQGVPKIDRVQATTSSFLLAGEYELGKGVALGARVPFSAGSLAAPASRGAAVLGNIEIEGAYKLELNESLAFELGVGVALPTADGTPVPEDPGAVAGAQGAIDQGAFDRGAIQRAVAMSRGYEDNALFETSHLGIIPKLTLEIHHRGFRFDPYAKLENLIATRSGEDHDYIGELVVGAAVGYAITKNVEPVIRVWTNVPLANTDFAAVAVAEPQLRLRFGEVVPYIGAILPFAGPLTNPYDVGVRFGVRGRL
jgi:hypothetical protein